MRQKKCTPEDTFNMRSMKTFYAVDTVQQWRDQLQRINEERNANCENKRGMKLLSDALDRFYESTTRLFLRQNWWKGTWYILLGIYRGYQIRPILKYHIKSLILDSRMLRNMYISVKRFTARLFVQKTVQPCNKWGFDSIGLVNASKNEAITAVYCNPHNANKNFLIKLKIYKLHKIFHKIWVILLTSFMLLY